MCQIIEKDQEREWEEAQKIELSVDLVNAAKEQLEFLAAVDRNRHLYEGPALQWAIFRYNAFWLPLLAKHSKNPLSEELLVVPLDCEWIWHCHRLDPERYKLDCEKLFGRILNNDNVISSVQGISINKTKEIWYTMYPEEPYELELNKILSRDILPKGSHYETSTTSYDLVSAVTRKIPFSFQVLKPHMSSNLFLHEAEARYKAFLYLMRTNKKKNIRHVCVPTLDIDLIWHSHQLHPVSYCEDLIKIVGEFVGHDDNISDQRKRTELDNVFSEFTNQWEETFGSRYLNAGAMYKGDDSTPVTHILFPFSSNGKQLEPTINCETSNMLNVIQQVPVLPRNIENKIEAKDEMVESARCFAGLNISTIDKVTTLDGNTKGEMKAYEETIQSARCFAGVNDGVKIDSMVESARCFARHNIRTIDKVTTLDENTTGKMKAYEETIQSARCFAGVDDGVKIDSMVESARCFFGLNISTIDKVTTLNGNTKGEMKAYDETIQSARCFAGVNDGVIIDSTVESARCFAGLNLSTIDKETTLDGKTKGKMKAYDEMIQSARCFAGVNDGVIIDSMVKNGVCETGGTCASGGYGNRFIVKNEAASGDCDGGNCATDCYREKCGVPRNDYSGGNYRVESAIKSAWCFACASKCW